MHLQIIRDTARTDAMLGTLTINDRTLYTLELPWIPIDVAPCGHPDTSCIPAGDYQLVRHDTLKHPHTFAFVNPALCVYHSEVPAGTVGRTECLLHSANWTRQLLGCCALGRERTFEGGLPMVANSVSAIQAFQALVPWVDGHTISILDETSGDRT